MNAGRKHILNSPPRGKVAGNLISYQFRVLQRNLEFRTSPLDPSRQVSISPLLGHTFCFCVGKAQTSEKQKNMCLFAKSGSWEALDGCKILPQVVGTICPPGKPHSVKKQFELCLGCLSSGRVWQI